MRAALLPLQGEKVGMRGLSANSERAEKPPHPNPLPLKGERERRHRAKHHASSPRHAGTGTPSIFAAFSPMILSLSASEMPGVSRTNSTGFHSPTG